MNHLNKRRDVKSIIAALALSLIFTNVLAQNGIYTYNENLDVSGDVPIAQHFSPYHYNFLNNRSDSGTWNMDFSIPGITGSVYVTGTDGSNLYIGGNFKTAGSIVANSIVKWDGQNWSSIGEGLENGITQLGEWDVASVHAITWADGKLFVGGLFRKAGSLEVNGIACWDGNAWQRLGNDSINGVRKIINLPDDTLVEPGNVYALYAHNNKVYVGGEFQMAGGEITNGVAVWDVLSETWESPGGGLASTEESALVYAYSFTSSDDIVYVGGKFNMAGGVPAQNIAGWDGSGWFFIGNAETYVFDLKIDQQGNLYATGYYTAGDPSGSSGLGKWDGFAWSSVNGPEGYTSHVSTLQVHNDLVYAAGSFVNPFEPQASLASWDGNEWQVIPGLGQSYNEFFLGNVSGIEFINDKMYVAGDFTKAGDVFPVNVVEWDYQDSTWVKLDDGRPNKGIHDGEIRAMDRNGEFIYAGGDFSVAGEVYAKNIARWNGVDWESLGTEYENGINGSVYTILVEGDTVYAGGYFGSAGTSEAYHIARWDGNTWSSIGIGVGGLPGAHVRALAKVGNFLYVGGNFAVVGDEENFELPANSIARFDLVTNRWEALGRGIEAVFGVPGRVNDMEVFEDKIYIGGEFLNADGMFFQNFTVLVDNKFSGIGDVEDVGIEGMVRTVEVINNEIFIGGVLQLDPEGAYVGMLKWEGANWAEFEGGLTADVGNVFINDIEAYENGFIVGGYFKYAGGTEVNNLAYFDGAEWFDLGGGIEPGVIKLAVQDNKIFSAGPTIMYAGGGLSIGFSQYYFDDASTGIEEGNTDDPLFASHIYPNPFSKQTTITYFIPAPGQVRITVYDRLGKEIATLIREYQPAGKHSIAFDGDDLPEGLYFYRIMHGNHSETKKMLLIK